jgi:hypothetical protein
MLLQPKPSLSYIPLYSVWTLCLLSYPCLALYSVWALGLPSSPLPVTVLLSGPWACSHPHYLSLCSVWALDLPSSPLPVTTLCGPWTFSHLPASNCNLVPPCLSSLPVTVLWVGPGISLISLPVTILCVGPGPALISPGLISLMSWVQ